MIFGRWYQLYAKPQKPELAMEPVVASLGIPYRFQHPFFGGVTGEYKRPPFFILDYYFPTLALALEIDGKEHRTLKGLKKDEARTESIGAKGLRVIRTTNERALEDPFTALLDAAKDAPDLLEYLSKVKAPVPQP